MLRAVGLGRWGVLALAVATFVACREPPRMRNVEATALFDVASLDFGEVPVGEWREQQLKIRNVGYVPFNAVEVLKLQNNPSYEVVLDGSPKVQPGEERAVRVRFHPLREGDLHDTLYVETDAEHRPEGSVPLRGRGAPTPIEILPRTLDFETLEVDSDRTLELFVRNPVDLPLTVRLAGESADQFGTEVQVIPPHETVALRTKYLPRRIGGSRAHLEVRACEDCTAMAADLTGNAVPFAFSFDPEPVPFDDIPVHEKTRSRTRARNITWRPVTVEALATSDQSFVPLADLGGRELRPGEEVEVPMEFAARFSGPSVGMLTIDYRSDRARKAQVVLDARGGRPQLALAPVGIDFGTLPIGGKLERVVRLTNAGTNGALRFKGVRASGDFTQFSVNVPNRGQTNYAWSGGAWPELTAPDLEIQPGQDFLDLRVYFEPTSEGQFRAELVFVSDDLFSPERVIVLTGSSRPSGPCTYRLSPAGQIDFGVIEQGHGAVLGFYFENVGPAECAVKNIRVSNSAHGSFFMPGGEIPGGVLLPDTAFSAMVAFRPTSGGRHDGMLELTINNPAQPTVQLPLLGTAVETCLTAAPPFVDFGPIRYDCSVEPRRTFLQNQCSLPITVERSWIGDGTSDQYSVVRGPEFPLTLDPGEGFEMELTYARDVLGQHYSPMYFHVGGEGRPYMVPLLAETNHEGLQRERFTQGADNQLDVLFVVSNTSTMQAYQERLKAAVPGFISQAQSRGVDLRVGVTTTGLVTRSATCPGGASGGEAGRLFPVNGVRARIVSSSSGSAASTVQQNLTVGACHNLVQGLETMRQALSSPLVDRTDDPRTVEPNDGNAGFLRPQARLAVIVLADEDDHSGFDTESYIQFLKSFKGPGMGHRVTMHAIVPTDPACRTAGAPGPRFSDTALATGGDVVNVCTASYQPLLDSIAIRAAGLQREFRLSTVPVSTDEMVVDVDGRTADPALWEYDPARNAVVFEATAVPQPGQDITVRYRSLCGAP